MNEKKRQELKRKLANVPNPPVPNRARTPMSVNDDNSVTNKNNNSATNKSNNDTNQRNNTATNKR